MMEPDKETIMKRISFDGEQSEKWCLRLQKVIGWKDFITKVLVFIDLDQFVSTELIEGRLDSV